MRSLVLNEVKDGDVEELEMVREMRGDEDIILKDNGDIEINNAPCVIRRHGPNSLHL